MSRLKPKLTVYYDGGCPQCVNDRCRYESLAGEEADSVCWFDISGKEHELRKLGIDPQKALTELHVKDENECIVSELDAYILLMSRVPVLKPLAWLIGLPVIRPMLSNLYRRLVIRRLKRSGRL